MTHRYLSAMLFLSGLAALLSSVLIFWLLLQFHGRGKELYWFALTPTLYTALAWWTLNALLARRRGRIAASFLCCLFCVGFGLLLAFWVNGGEFCTLCGIVLSLLGATGMVQTQMLRSEGTPRQ